MVFQSFFDTSIDWFVCSFSSATLDYFFGMTTLDSHLLNTLFSLIQLSLSALAANALLYELGQRKGSTQPYLSWLAPVVIWQMSPNATRKLINSYNHFHVLLYGSDSQ